MAALALALLEEEGVGSETAVFVISFNAPVDVDEEEAESADEAGPNRLRK